MYKDLDIRTSIKENKIIREFEIFKNDLNDIDVIEQIYNILGVYHDALKLNKPYKNKKELLDFLQTLGNTIQFTFISSRMENAIIIS
jgi:predicted DNA-binding protein YlxM (UPF0122 family)